MARERILLLEDDELVSEVMRYALQAEGYPVDSAASVDAAWALLATRRYDIVIADWKLPDGEGTIIANAAAELGAKTLLVSGYLQEMPAGQADGHETLTKPVRPADLVAAVRSVLEGTDKQDRQV